MINLNSVLQSNQKSPFETKLFRNNPSVCVNVLPWQPANLAARGTWGSEAGADEALTAGFHLTIGAGSFRICGPTHSTYVKGGYARNSLTGDTMESCCCTALGSSMKEFPDGLQEFSHTSSTRYGGHSLLKSKLSSVLSAWPIYSPCLWVFIHVVRSTAFLIVLIVLVVLVVLTCFSRRELLARVHQAFSLA